MTILPITKPLLKSGPEELMDILYLSAEYPPETGYGGIGTYTKHIAEGMVRQGHSVTVIARSDTGEATCVRRNDVEVHRIIPLPHPLPAWRYAYPLRWFCRRLFPHTLTRLCWGLAIARHLDYFKTQGRSFDIIEAPECGAEGMFIPYRAGRHRFVVRLHTPWKIISKLDEIKEPAGDALLLPLLEKRTTRRADAVSAPSRAIAALLQRAWHLDNVTIIANPLPVTKPETTLKKGWIYTGRIERRKGVHHLITAYAAVKRERTVPALTLIGSAYGSDRNGIPYGDSLRALIDANGLNGDIAWISHAGLDEVTRHLQGATVAFFPSLWENFPYACIEAMSCGCAVVASDCGGLREIVVDGESGLLVEPGSAKVIADAMRRLLDKPGYAGTLGEGARKRAAGLTDAEQVCNEMEIFYSKVRST